MTDHTLDCRIFTNLEICQIPLVTKGVDDSVSKWIRGRDDIRIEGYVDSMIPGEVKRYWRARGPQRPSPAALTIEASHGEVRRLPG